MLKNQLLQQAQAKIEQGVTDRARYDKLVQAGTKIIYDKATFATLSKSIAESDKPVEDIAKGIVAILNIMASKARGTIPHDVFLQAGMALMLDALDFCEQAGLLTVDNKVLDQATFEYLEALPPSVGLNQQRMGEVLSQVKGIMEDPARMQQFQATQGGAK